jgi:hypothetical protein
MIQWVLDALGESKTIERVIITGLAAESGVTCTKPTEFYPNQGEMIENIRSGIVKALEHNPIVQHVMIVSSDVPAIRTEMVDWIAGNITPQDDMLYHVISRETMERRFPGSRRTYMRLKDAEVCGGDVNVIRAQTVTSNDALWRKIIASRKSPIKQAALLGFDTLLLILLHRLTLEAAARRASQRIGMRGRAILCPFAEIGMDVDKPGQLEMMRADLAARAG